MGKLSAQNVRRFVAVQESFTEAREKFKLGTFADFLPGMEKLANDLANLALAIVEAFTEVKKELNEIDDKLDKVLKNQDEIKRKLGQPGGKSQKTKKQKG